MNTPETPDASSQWAMDLARTVDPNDESLWDYEIEKIARLLVKVRRDALEEAAREAENQWLDDNTQNTGLGEDIRALKTQEVAK